MTTTTNIDQLSTIEEATVLELLKTRLEQDEIYTFAGSALVAVNPYGGSQADTALTQLVGGVLSKLQGEKKNQTILLKGERGSGKTSQARKVVSLIAEKLGAEASSLNTSFEATTAVLAAIGQAKTVASNSANRTLSLTQIQFDESGALIGSKLVSALYDTARVSSVQHSERNFNVFYQLASNSDAQKKYELENADKYHYLNQASTTVSGVDDSQNFDNTSKALDTLGISAAEKDQFFSALAGILHLGNVTFTQTGDKAQVADKAVVARAAKYLGVSAQTLEDVLVSITFKRGSETVIGTADEKKAQNLRDALAQAVYKKLYETLVERINVHLKLKEAAVKTTLSIVELTGFEVHMSNGREQLYINYVNEIAQDAVHKNSASAEFIKAVTSTITILSEQARMHGSSPEKVTEALANALKTNKAFAVHRFNREVFTLKHNAGHVEYQTPLLVGYVVANDKQKEVLQSSSNALLQGNYVIELPIVTVKKTAASLTALLKDSQVTEVINIIPNFEKKPKTLEEALVQDQIRIYRLVDLAKESKK